MQARASGSGSECLALRASLQCAALLLGPRPQAQHLTAFQEMLSEAALRSFQVRGRGITVPADSSHLSPFPVDPSALPWITQVSPPGFPHASFQVNS